MNSPDLAVSLSGATALTDLGVIRVAGDDAVSFLQGQLTQDVALLKPDEVRLAAFCNAKGRMQASFIVFKRQEADAQVVLLVCHRDILPQTLKRLSMFVMRAKAKLTDATDAYQLVGVTGAAVDTLAGGPLAAGTKLDIADASLAALQPGAGVARALWCAPADAALPAAGAVGAITLADWHWLGVQSGIALISQPIFEALVPQMLNYESVGGVNFKKGCYPGQEIVARSQFRGTLKRRAYLVGTDGDPAVGQEIFHAADAEQPCGLVAAAAPRPGGGFDAIVSMQTSAAADAGTPDAPRLTLGSASGPALHLQALPYALLEDI